MITGHVLYHRSPFPNVFVYSRMTADFGTTIDDSHHPHINKDRVDYLMQYHHRGVYPYFIKHPKDTYNKNAYDRCAYDMWSWGLLSAELLYGKRVADAVKLIQSNNKIQDKFFACMMKSGQGPLNTDIGVNKCMLQADAKHFLTECARDISKEQLEQNKKRYDGVVETFHPPLYGPYNG